MRKDVENYILSCTKDLLKEQEILNKINKQIDDGILEITPELMEVFINRFELVKANFNRVNYIWFLLNRKPRWIEKIINKLSNNKLEKEMKKYKDENADLEAIQKENKEALETMKEMEVKEDE